MGTLCGPVGVMAAWSLVRLSAIMATHQVGMGPRGVDGQDTPVPPHCTRMFLSDRDCFGLNHFTRSLLLPRTKEVLFQTPGNKEQTVSCLLQTLEPEFYHQHKHPVRTSGHDLF